MRDSKNRQYSREWLQYERPQPMYDNDINKLYDSFYQNNPVHTHNLDDIFKDKFAQFMRDHKLSNFKGLDKFEHRDIIIGCTQFIDDLYQRCGTLQIVENDYKYHWRLNPDLQPTTLDNLDPNKELLISMPFPYFGDVHPNMQEILDKCYEIGIPVHIDSAWIGCIRDIDFDYDHPAIQTIGISLSKGGLGGNRIGMRYARKRPEGSVTIMNNFNMNNQALVSMGIHFIDNIGPEHFWNKYGDKYYQVCKDFNLTSTKAIHLAKENGKPVGVRPLLRAKNISKTFCVMPFIHQNIKHEGRVTACWRCHETLGNINESSLEEIFNNDKTKLLRKQLLNGEQPEGCRSCWNLENSNAVSTRQKQLKNYFVENNNLVVRTNQKESVVDLHTYVNQKIDADYKLPYKLKSIEIRFDNICNQMCRHCSPIYSSMWEKAAKKQPNLYKEKLGNYESLTDETIDEIVSNADQLDEIIISGGEPLYHKKHYNFLERLLPNAKNIVLYYNSNLSTLEHGGKSVLDLWKHFKGIHLIVSLDGYPEIYSYVRAYGDITKVENNIKQVQTLDNVVIKGTITTSVLNITRLPQIFDYYKSLGIGLHTSIVQYPESLNIQILPKSLKQEITNKWKEYKTDEPGDNLINYMNASDKSSNWKSFVEYMNVQDEYHSTKLIDVYPEFKDYL